MNRQHCTLFLLLGILCCLSMAEKPKKCQVSVTNLLGKNKELKFISYVGPQDLNVDKYIYQLDNKTIAHKSYLARRIPVDTIYYCRMCWKEGSSNAYKKVKKLLRRSNAEQEFIWKGGFFVMYREERDKSICSGQYGSACKWFGNTTGLYQFDQRVKHFVFRYGWETLTPKELEKMEEEDKKELEEMEEEDKGHSDEKGKQKEQLKT